MAKLYFYYSTMNAGKTTLLLQSRYNYMECNKRVLCFIPDLLVKDGQMPAISSRIGIKAEAISFDRTFSFKAFVEESGSFPGLACILVDEAQFLTEGQVLDLCAVVDQLDIPVLAYGLRTDFLGRLFEGSQHLLGLADELVEVKTVCFCGKKATMVVRFFPGGEVSSEGPQVEYGGNERYLSLCRRHHREALQSGTLPRALPTGYACCG